MAAGLVVAAKSDLRLKHIEFIRLDAERALAVIVGENGSVENRILALPAGTTASTSSGGGELHQCAYRRSDALRIKG